MGKISDVFGKSLDVEANVADKYSIQDQEILTLEVMRPNYKKLKQFMFPQYTMGTEMTRIGRAKSKYILYRSIQNLT